MKKSKLKGEINYQLMDFEKINKFFGYRPKTNFEKGIKDTKPYSPKPRKDRLKEVDDWLNRLKSQDTRVSNYGMPSYEEIRNQK